MLDLVHKIGRGWLSLSNHTFFIRRLLQKMSTSTCSNTAKERWGILRAAILSAAGRVRAESVSNVSVRSFTSYGLFAVTAADQQTDQRWMVYTPLQQESQQMNTLSPSHESTSVSNDSVQKRIDQGPLDCDQSTPQHDLTTPVCDGVLIRVLSQSTSLQDMIGFNNTGNVCIWPSEEVLAHYCLTHSQLFKGHSVCELGCGMSALAGLSLACTSLPTHVLLTDGNKGSVENVKAIVSKNANKFGGTSVSGEVLCWDDSFLATPTAHDGQYDWVICADCLFFNELHSSLLQTLLKLLKQGSGQVLMFAPRRGHTFDQFIAVAKETFTMETAEQYDPLVTSKHEELIRDGCHGYKPDLHYPIMLTMAMKK